MMKRWSFCLVMAALVLAIVAPASADLLFDRGLPTANLNNAAGTSRSNVAWADSETTATTVPYYLPGDDFKIGTGGIYNIDTIRVWTVDRNTNLRLFGGLESGSMQLLSSTFASSSVLYVNNESYQGGSGIFKTLYQVDFSVNWNVTGGQTYQFFVDGPFIDEGSRGFINTYLHASNAALSVSTQEGANDKYLWLNMVTNSYPSGIPGTVDIYDSKGNGWDKSSDINVRVYGSQVPLPGALVLLGAGLVRLAAYSRRKKALA